MSRPFHVRRHRRAAVRMSPDALRIQVSECRTALANPRLVPFHTRIASLFGIYRTELIRRYVPAGMKRAEWLIDEGQGERLR